VQTIEILPKISAFKQYYLRKQELIFCVRDTATLLLSGVFLRSIAARLSKCPPFFGVVILMTFFATLGIYGIASRNFIIVSLCAAPTTVIIISSSFICSVKWKNTVE